MKVLITPDSFKGTLSNLESAEAIAQGWLSIRPHDQISILPMADGGEGTLETIALRYEDAIRVPTKLERESCWLLLQDGTAIVELADICGITHLSKLDPLYANTFDLGVVLKSIIQDQRVGKIVFTVGGSASTDGGVGALMALGARFNNSDGKPIPLGGIGLTELVSMDLSEIPPAPSDGVTCLVDVTNHLVGPQGSARIFGPQKGATEEQVELLELGLNRLKEVSGREDFPGAGAAGGTPYGLNLAWSISLDSGALAVATLIGLEKAIAEADLVITGEGRLDEQSYFGKVVGVVSSIANQFDTRIIYCVGSSAKPLDEKGIALTDLAPSLEDAMSHPKKWLIAAGGELANREGD